MVARDGLRSDACIENERQNVHVFSSAYSNIKGRENLVARTEWCIDSTSTIHKAKN